MIRKMEIGKQPLAEVFGHVPADMSSNAKRFRKNRLCPYNNKVPNCTKDKAKDPLGVCSINTNSGPVITCPIRFRENWLIAEDAASFFFPENASWTSLTEVRLNDADGKSAGNIDVVLVAYDDKGQVYDFGSLEVQAVYISGNVRDPYAYYMEKPTDRATMDWSSQPNYPRPDFLSSSRKRLAPQMIFKGGILNAWGKKMAVALDSAFFATLPALEEVPEKDAEVAWLVYDLLPNDEKAGFSLQRIKTVYTRFNDSLNVITTPKVGRLEIFMNKLQSKVDEKLESEPTNNTVENPLES